MLQEIPFTKASGYIAGVCSSKDKGFHPIPIGNTDEVRSLLADADMSAHILLRASYGRGVEIVREGAIVDDDILGCPELSYAFVPLGFITRGRVTIIKGGKGTKSLQEGDFLGLFETSDFLLTRKKRKIGDWSLVTETPDTEILYFNKGILQESSELAGRFREYLISLSRADRVPQPISTLPLLDWVANHTTKERPLNCAVIAHTHLLPNNAPLFRHLAALLDFGRIYAMDKPYSTVPSVLRELVWSGFEVVPVRMEADFPYEFSVRKSLDVLWDKVVEDQKHRGYEKILIIDDGGDVWQSVPWDDLEGVSVAAVEQTQRGIARVLGGSKRVPPIVSVASAGIKKNIESEFIGISVVKKLDELGVLKKAIQVGIVGAGSIGLAVNRELRRRGVEALSYDPKYHSDDALSENRRASLDVLLNECDLIVGTTGTDALKGLPFERVMTGQKVLASASSADLEFFSLLKLAPSRQHPFETVRIPVHDRLTIDILNGGYPINFDREKDSTPDDDIVLTRCLMYVGAMQALELIDRNIKEGVFGLDRVAQARILEQWIKDKERSGSEIPFSKQNIEEAVGTCFSNGEREMASVWIETTEKNI